MKGSKAHHFSVDYDRCSCGSTVVYYEDPDRLGLTGEGCESTGLTWESHRFIAKVLLTFTTFGDATVRTMELRLADDRLSHLPGFIHHTILFLEQQRRLRRVGRHYRASVEELLGD